jgi:hypothetical protein
MDAAADNDNHHNQLHSNCDLSQDRQSRRRCEIMSLPTQVFTEGRRQQLIVKRKKKCSHGNRKLQHFKRKCRARGLNEEEITTLICERNSRIFEQLLNDQIIIHEQTKKPNKRKRDQSNHPTELVNSSVKSLSQLSISREERDNEGKLKKMKNSTLETMSSSSLFSNNDNDNSNQSNQDNNITLYKLSKYLKMPRKLLLHSLHFQLNYRLKKKKEQRFVLSRLKLFDQQFCNDQIRHLYQFCFDQGLQHQVWPVSFRAILLCI